jgi:hypothetical protein
MTKAKVSEERLVVGGSYRNRRGDYVVRSVGPDAVEVEYMSGEKATLNKQIQERILRNAESESRMMAEIEYEQAHPRPEIKSLEDYICSFCVRPGWNTRCKLSAECKAQNMKLGCSSPTAVKEKTEKSDPKEVRLRAWTEKKVKTLQEMTVEEINAEIARLEAR